MIIGLFNEEPKKDLFVEEKNEFYTDLDTLKLEDLTESQWIQINSELAGANWAGFDDLDPEGKYLRIIDNLLTVLKKYATIKEFVKKGKKRVPRELRILFRRKAKVSKKLKLVHRMKDIVFAERYLKENRKLEASIKQFSKDEKLKEEANLLEQLKDNRNELFKYMKKRGQ